MTTIRFVFFFFFQAEDGIRDVAVTGVQTCALPILKLRPIPLEERRMPPAFFLRQDVHLTLKLRVRRDALRLRQHHPPLHLVLLHPPQPQPHLVPPLPPLPQLPDHLHPPHPPPPAPPHPPPPPP